MQTRRLIRKYDLERIFCNLGINWERLGIFYHNLTSHIQFIYLEFQTQKQAEIVYLDRKNYESKLEKFDLTIAPLNEWILKSNTRFTNLENMICIIKPLTTLEIMDELPSDEGYLQKIVGLLENITELSCFEFKITEDINKITGSTLRNHLYITFPNPSYVDRVYNAQPLFGCLLVHKMSHNKICPFIKYNYELCLVCENPKNKTCLLDLCKKCCSKQKFKILNCDCGIESLSLVKINEENNLIENKYCEICKVIYVEKCANNLCETCCKVQFERLQCEEHEKPIFLKNILKM